MKGMKHESFLGGIGVQRLMKLLARAIFPHECFFNDQSRASKSISFFLSFFLSFMDSFIQ